MISESGYFLVNQLKLLGNNLARARPVGLAKAAFGAPLYRGLQNKKLETNNPMALSFIK